MVRQDNQSLGEQAVVMYQSSLHIFLFLNDVNELTECSQILFLSKLTDQKCKETVVFVWV